MGLFTPFAYIRNKVLTGVVTNNLELFYDAGNTASYPGSGTSWFNLQPASLTSTLINGPTFSTNNGGTIVFDGTNDYATRATFSALNFGTGDFAIEAWVRITGNSAANTDGIREATIFAVFPETGAIASTYAFSIQGNSTTTGTGLSFGARDASATFQNPTLSFTFTQNVFYQIGITHIAGVTKFFVNGTSYAASSNLSINLQTSTRPVQIGRLGYGAGYAQNLAGTIGIVRIYSGGGLTDAQILQNYNANVNRAAGSVTTSGTQYFLVPTNDVFNFGTGDFTVEGFVKLTSGTAFNREIMQWENNGGFGWGYNSSNQLIAFQAGVGAVFFTTTLSTNIWYHVAFSRSGGTLRAFVNGTQVGTNQTFTNNLSAPAGNMVVGRGRDSVQHWPGRYTNFRITKGVALYTSNFTAPTSQLTSTSNTSLLLLARTVDTFTVDTTGINTITNVGATFNGDSPFIV
jgi:hypothetical protein